MEKLIGWREIITPFKSPSGLRGCLYPSLQTLQEPSFMGKIDSQYRGFQRISSSYQWQTFDSFLCYLWRSKYFIEPCKISRKYAALYNWEEYEIVPQVWPLRKVPGELVYDKLFNTNLDKIGLFDNCYEEGLISKENICKQRINRYEHLNLLFRGIHILSVFSLCE